MGEEETKETKEENETKMEKKPRSLKGQRKSVEEWRRNSNINSNCNSNSKSKSKRWTFRASKGRFQKRRPPVHEVPCTRRLISGSPRSS